MGLLRITMLLMLATVPACAQAPAPQSAADERRILLPPPVQWDNEMLSSRPALQQTRSDFATLTGGFAFGMSSSDLNARLPEPYPGMSWSALTLANEYPGEVKFFGVPMDAAGPLRLDVSACTGTGSYLVFLFNRNGLFRISYRLTADKTCPDPGDAALRIFAKYVTIGQGVALSVRYRAGKTEVVDVTDPTVSYLAPIRWRQGGL